jgi:hypothetical protein
METWKHGDMETWRHGDMETWRHGDMETWRHGDKDKRTSNGQQKTENESPCGFPYSLPFAYCANGSLSIVRFLTK